MTQQRKLFSAWLHQGQIGNWNPCLSEELMIVLGYTGKEPKQNRGANLMHSQAVRLVWLVIISGLVLWGPADVRGNGCLQGSLFLEPEICWGGSCSKSRSQGQKWS